VWKLGPGPAPLNLSRGFKVKIFAKPCLLEKLLWNNDQKSNMVISQKPSSKDNVRESILDAMDRLLARYGYQKTTVDDLATEAGIGKGSVYLYFSSKEQVALSCIDRLHDRLMARITCIAQDDQPARDKITEILLERVMHRFQYCNRNATSMDQMLAALKDELMTRKDVHHAKEAELLEQLLLDAGRSGELPLCDCKAAAQAMILATNALLPYSIRTTQLGSPEVIEQKVRDVASLLVLGLAGLPAVTRN